MSWHFLQEQEEASWEAHFLDGAPSALSSLIPTAAECCFPDSGMDCCRDFRSGTTSPRSTANRGGSGSMSSAGDFPARKSPTVPPSTASASDWMAIKADCGARCGELLARFDRDTLSWKTPQAWLDLGLAEFSPTFTNWGTMRDGECWALIMPERLTAGPELGLLPTPVASEWKDKGRASTLAMLDRGGRLARRICSRLIAHSTERVVANPCFSEWLMGWPVGWTITSRDLKPLATDKFQQWLRSHGVCLEGQSDEN
jgi:hypothetical protein